MNLFEILSKIGDFTLFIIIVVSGFALFFLGIKIFKVLSKRYSEKLSKVISVLLCIIIAAVSSVSLFCSYFHSIYYSDKITVIFFDEKIVAGETMHIVFKGKPNTAYDIEFESILKSEVIFSNGAGYATYTFKTERNSEKGEESFYIYERDSGGDITTDYYSILIE